MRTFADMFDENSKERIYIVVGINHEIDAKIGDLISDTLNEVDAKSLSAIFYNLAGEEKKLRENKSSKKTFSIYLDGNVRLVKLETAAQYKARLSVDTQRTQEIENDLSELARRVKDLRKKGVPSSRINSVI